MSDAPSIPAALTLENMTRHTLEVNGHQFAVFEAGSGPAVFLLHGFPGSSASWRSQIPPLLDAGFRVIAPDLLGEGDSDMPEAMTEYTFAKDLEHMLGILNALKIDTVQVVAHDRGAVIGWLMAALAPNRVTRLVVMSVGHPNANAEASLAQKEKSWYTLLFQFHVAEELFQRNNWEFFRQFMRHHPETEVWIKDLSRPGSLNASLNWYRANFNPDTSASRALPKTPERISILGLWSTGDYYLGDEQMLRSVEHVEGEWHYERIDSASHFMMVDRADQVNQLLLNFLVPTP